jgi:hypothetical protein
MVCHRSRPESNVLGGGSTRAIPVPRLGKANKRVSCATDFRLHMYLREFTDVTGEGVGDILNASFVTGLLRRLRDNHVSYQFNSTPVGCRIRNK